MNITNSAQVMRFGLVVSIALVFVSFATFAPARAQTNVDDLLRQIQELQNQIRSLEGSESTSTTTISSSVCPFQWSRNLTQGSTGEDVLKLQQFLNSDPDTRIASSGVGSPGSESTFYGSLTSAAVSKYQEKYASSILTPLGLTQGTGGFYTGTRTHANGLCSSASSSSTGSVVADAESVVVAEVTNSRGGHAIANGVAVGGALRVPFTTFTVTAPSSGSVTITGVEVRRVGLSDDENFDGIILLDEDGLVLGNDRRLRSSTSRATVGERVRISSGDTRTFTVAANITTDSEVDFGGQIAALEIVGIETDAEVIGLPIRGANHVFNDNIDLSQLEVDRNSADSGTFEINEEVEFASIELQPSGDDDLYLRSITFEQTGSASSADLDINFIVDGESFSPRVNGDLYTVTFDGQGLLIDEDDSIDVSVEGVVEDGSGRTVQFTLEDEDSIYAVSREYGYGVSLDGGRGVNFDDSPAYLGDVINISGGNASSGRERLAGNEDEAVIDFDDELLGRFELEVEGEDLDIQDFRFDVTATIDDIPDTGGTAVDETARREVESLSLHLGDRRVGDADDIRFNFREDANADRDTATETNVVFDFDDELSEDTYVFDIRGRLADDWEDGERIQFTVRGVGRAEGVTSGDRTSSTALFGDDGVDLDEVTATEGDFEVNLASRAATDVVSGNDDVVFLELEFDASDTDTDIRVDEITVVFTTGGMSPDTSHLENCEIRSDDERVSRRSRDLPSGTDPETVTFSISRGDLDIEAGSVATAYVVCDLDDSATAGITYVASIPEGESVDYTTLGSRQKDVSLDFAADQMGNLLTVSLGGNLIVTVSPESTQIVPVGGADVLTNVVIGTIEFEARDEDITIEEFTINVVEPTSNRNNVIAAIRLFDGNNLVDSETSVPSSGTVDFNSVNFDVEDGKGAELEVRVDLNPINDGKTGVAGQQVRLTLEMDSVIASGENQIPEDSISGIDSDVRIGTIYTHRSVPEFSHITTNIATQLNTGDLDIYAFSVTAPDEGDVSIQSLAFEHSLGGGATIGDVEIRAYEDSTFSNALGDISDSSGLITTDTSTKTSGTPYIIDFGSEIVTIDAGQTVYFRLQGEITAAPDESSLSTKLVSDEGSTIDSSASTATDSSLGSARLVWSPHSEFNSVDLTTEDWFSGEEVIGGDDLSTTSLRE